MDFLDYVCIRMLFAWSFSWEGVRFADVWRCGYALVYVNVGGVRAAIELCAY